MSDLQALVDELAACDEEGIVTVITSVLQARPEAAPAVVQFAVPDLTYPPARVLNERRAAGTVKSYNESKGFGFIACEELSSVFGNDVFLHMSQAPAGGVSPGQRVTFAVALNKENKPQAFDLQLGELHHGKGASAPTRSPWAPQPSGGKESAGKGWHSFMEAAFSMMGKGGKGGGSRVGGKGDGGGKGGPKQAEDGDSIGEYSGTIKSYNGSNGYGFIDCPEVKEQYGNDVFLHQAHIGDHSVGDEVTFEVFENKSGKPQAKNVRAADGAETWPPPAKKQKTGGAWGDV